MKKITYNLAVLTLIISVFASTGCLDDEWFPEKGNGKMTTAEKSVSSFDKICSYAAGEVRYHESDEYRVEVTTDGNLQNNLNIYSQNDVLYIKVKKGKSCSFTKLTVDVYSPSLSGVSIHGSGNFESKERIETSSFDANISGSGKIKGRLECERFSAKISGSGRISLFGYCDKGKIAISGSGKFNSEEFEMKRAVIDINGSGNMEVWVTESLKADISGSGKVYYRGEPTIESKIKGSGKFRRL